MLDSRDVMLFISYSGSAKELDLIVPRLEEKGIPLLAMTGKSTSPLALAAKAVLDIAVEREGLPDASGANLQHRQHADAGRRVGDGGDAGARFQ